MAIKEEEYFTKAIPDALIDSLIPNFNQMEGKMFEILFCATVFKCPKPFLDQSRNSSSPFFAPIQTIPEEAKLLREQPQEQSCNLTKETQKFGSRDTVIAENDNFVLSFGSTSKKVINEGEYFNLSVNNSSQEYVQQRAKQLSSIHEQVENEARITAESQAIRRLTLPIDIIVAQRKSTMFQQQHPSFSDSYLSAKNMLGPKEGSRKTEYKVLSTIFKGRNFYARCSDKKKMIESIVFNSGNLIRDLEKYQPDSRNKNVCVYVLLNDGDLNSIEIVKKAQQENKKLRHIRYVSPRFIKHCLDSKIFISNPQKESLIHLLPFNCKVPIMHAEKVKIFVKFANLGVQDTYEKCCSILGFLMVEEKAEANVLIVEKSLIPKFAESLKNSAQIIVKDSFVLECIQYGKIYDANVRKLLGLEVEQIAEKKKVKKSAAKSPVKPSPKKPSKSLIETELFDAFVDAQKGSEILLEKDKEISGSSARGDKTSSLN